MGRILKEAGAPAGLYIKATSLFGSVPVELGQRAAGDPRRMPGVGEHVSVPHFGS